MNEMLVGVMFIVQAIGILGGVYMGFKFGQGKPLVEKKETMMDLNEFILPPEVEPEYPIEQPYISWKMKEPDYGDAEEK
jgi:hypothetical protein